MNRLLSFFLISLFTLPMALINSLDASLTIKEPLLLIYPDHNELSKKAANIFCEEVKKSELDQILLTFILPTGGTPEQMYENIVQKWEKNELNLSSVTTFNMDEYVGIEESNPQSYHHYMKTKFHHLVCNEMTKEKLLRYGIKQQLATHSLIQEINQLSSKKANRQKILALLKKYNASTSEAICLAILRDIQLRSKGISLKNVHIPDGTFPKAAQEYRNKYLSKRREKNSRVILFGGIGRDPAHIAFNDLTTEPLFQSGEETKLTELAKATHTRIVDLSEGTISANSRFFTKREKVPTQAITIGFDEMIGPESGADKIVILISGKSKQQALQKTVQATPPTYKVPASLLKFFTKGPLLFLVDHEAAKNVI